MLRKIAKVILIVTVAGLIFSCSEDKVEEKEESIPDAQKETFVFECDSAFSFTVQIAGETALLKLSDKEYKLNRVESASGMKYSSDGIIFWSKGEEAFLELEDTTYHNCRNNGVAAVWEEAKLKGVDFRASGFEPGWILEISDNKKTKFETNYGKDKYEFVTPKPEIDKETNEIVYKFKNNRLLLTVTIKKEKCHDAKGDEYEHTVYLEFRDQNLRGCGKKL